MWLWSNHCLIQNAELCLWTQGATSDVLKSRHLLCVLCYTDYTEILPDPKMCGVYASCSWGGTLSSAKDGSWGKTSFSFRSSATLQCPLSEFILRTAYINSQKHFKALFYFDLYPNWLNLQQKNIYIYFGHNFVETWKLEIGELWKALTWVLLSSLVTQLILGVSRPIHSNSHIPC